MSENQKPTRSLVKGNTNIVLVVLLVIASFLIGSLWTRTQFIEKEKAGGKVAGTEAENPTAKPTIQEPQGPITETIDITDVTTFSQKKDAKICKTNGKPNIYLFSTTTCPHCTWIKETFDKVAKEYVDAGKINAYHWEIDINDNTLTANKETEVPKEMMAIYQEFNPGGYVPTFVFGCKYFRTGNGFEQQNDLKSEEKEFRAVIEKLIKS